MKNIKLIFVSLLAALVIMGSPAGARASGAVNNDMVLGFLMGFAQNNSVQGGDFIGGLTGTALGGSVPSTGGGITNIGNVVGSGGLTGGLLGGAFSGALNATGINGLQAINTNITDPMNSIGTGFVFGQMMAGLNNNLGTQGLSLGSIAGMTIPGLNGLNGGVGANTSIGAIVSSVMGQSATAGAITNLMNGGLLGNALSGVTGGIQLGGANLLLNSLGVGGAGNNMGLSSVGQMALGSIFNGTSGISGLSSLNLLNATSGSGLLNSLVSGGGNFASGAAGLGMIGNLLSGGMANGGANLFGSGAGSILGASSLFSSGQSMMQNASAVAQNLLGGNFLGGALQNAIGSAVGSAIGQTVNNALGSGLSNLLGMATGAMSSLSQAVSGALGALTGSLGGLLSGSLGSLLGGTGNPVANAVSNIANNPITNATNAFSNSLAGLLNCNIGTTSPTGTNPTNPTNPTTPTGPGGGWCTGGVGTGTAGQRISQGAVNSIGASTANIAGTDGGALGCAIAVSRILECSCGSVGQHLSTVDLYNALNSNPCYQRVDTGSISDANLQPGDVLVTQRGSRAGHTGIYVGGGNIVSNSSGGFQGSSPGTVQQNYNTSSWESVTNRNPGGSAVFRNICNC